MARPSHVRSAIEELLTTSARHDWTIETVGLALKDRGIPADPSSVFRGLVRLRDDGVIDQVDLGDGKLRFEAKGQHHEHVTCETCGSVRAVPGCLVERAIPEIERETGFTISGHRLLFAGRCARCAGSA